MVEYKCSPSLEKDTKISPVEEESSNFIAVKENHIYMQYESLVLAQVQFSYSLQKFHRNRCCFKNWNPCWMKYEPMLNISFKSSFNLH